MQSKPQATPVTFQDLPLSPSLLKALTELGYEKPSPIQAQALPILLGEPTDFIGLAATGTGKTAAFSIPLIERIDPALKEPQGLILCPTRELAVQVSGQIRLLGKHLGIKTATVYGGASYGDQIRDLRSGATVVIGTPGRILDHLDRGTLSLSGLTTVILDEADEMISMGFKEDLEKILSTVPEMQANTWLFSATMSREVRKVADEYLEKPALVEINRTEMLPTTIEQIYYKTDESFKPEIICRIMDAADGFYGLIFCQTKSFVIDLTQDLNGRGYKVDCLHGDMDQNARDRVMRAFRERKLNVLVCTDVASRGLDVKDVTHVINYSIPRELDNYVHRIGRTGRSGKTGFAMSLVTPSHKGLLGRIEKMTKTKIVEGKLPSRKDIATVKATRLLEKFKDVQDHAKAIELLNTDWAATLAEMSGDEIAGRFLALLCPDLLAAKAEPAQALPKAAPKFPNRRFEKPRFERGERSDRESRGFGDKRGFGEKRSFGENRGFGAKRDFSEKREFSSEKPMPWGASRGGEKPQRGFGKPKGEKRWARERY